MDAAEAFPARPHLTFASAALALALFAALPATSRAQPQASQRTPSVSVTRHHGVFGGQPVDYTATVTENILSGPDGVPNASLITFAYVRDGVANPARRPVAFVFNGGPGGSSSPLHMSGVGPRKIVAGKTQNNPDSLLDTADLVFIDPVGTGFSRPFTAAAGKQYWGNIGDSNSVAEVIGRWLKANHREASPHYLIGESYGTVRNGMLLKNHAALRFDGVVQIAVVTDMIGDQNYVATLPTMATTAWYWKKTPQDRDVLSVFNQAGAFASGDYAAALAKGDALPASEKHRIAEKVSALTSLPVALVEEKNLRLSIVDFMFNVLKAEGLRTGQLDTRVTAPLAGASADAIDDPALSGGKARQTLGAGFATAAGPGAAAAPAAPPSPIATYITQELGFRTAETTYRGVNFDAALAWDPTEGGDRGLHSDIHGFTAKAMQQHPKMRLFWTAGTYDFSTPAYGVVLAMDKAGVPKARTTAMVLPGPHSVFQEADNRVVLGKALRQFLRGQPVTR